MSIGVKSHALLFPHELTHHHIDIFTWGKKSRVGSEHTTLLISGKDRWSYSGSFPENHRKSCVIHNLYVLKTLVNFPSSMEWLDSKLKKKTEIQTQLAAALSAFAELSKTQS